MKKILKNILFAFILSFFIYACSSYKMILSTPVIYPTFNELYDSLLSKKYDTLFVSRNLKMWVENKIVSVDNDTLTQYFLYLPIDKKQETIIYINNINDSVEYFERYIIKKKK